MSKDFKSYLLTLAIGSTIFLSAVGIAFVLRPQPATPQVTAPVTEDTISPNVPWVPAITVRNPDGSLAEGDDGLPFWGDERFSFSNESDCKTFMLSDARFQRSIMRFARKLREHFGESIVLDLRCREKGQDT